MCICSSAPGCALVTQNVTHTDQQGERFTVTVVSNDTTVSYRRMNRPTTCAKGSIRLPVVNHAIGARVACWFHLAQGKMQAWSARAGARVRPDRRKESC